VGKAVALLSGPSGLASFLRRRQLGRRLGGPSLPLDVGVSRDIPAAIRTVVIARDQHCRYPGGCDQPAAGCEIHHTIPHAHGGRTSIEDCGLFYWFHHHIVIHEWGWTVVLNPDGTTTVYSPDKTKILHSHGPPRPSGSTLAPTASDGGRLLQLTTFGPHGAVVPESVRCLSRRTSRGSACGR
jgi:hypothetical protein